MMNFFIYWWKDRGFKDYVRNLWTKIKCKCLCKRINNKKCHHQNIEVNEQYRLRLEQLKKEHDDGK